MFRLSTCVLLVVVVYADAASDHESRDGRYTGYALKSISGRVFSAFSGIRYALPPIGDLRFQDPVPYDDPVDAKVNAIFEGNACLQVDPILSPDKITGDEDCLFLNIYTHNVTGKTPVMVWIHGGGWRFGSGNADFYGPSPIMDEDVVLVTMNYRLGPLGFASFENSVLAGNYGLKDQEEAIRWISRNINNFGGDSEKITLFGQSVGGASVTYHIKGRISGLVSRGIAQSGSSLSPWAFAPEASVRNVTLKTARNAKCKETSDEGMKKCLMSLSGHEIMEATRLFTMFEQVLLPFRPVLETDGPVPDDPWNLPASKLPLMMGFSSAESAFFATFLLDHDGFLLKILGRAFNSFIPEVLMYHHTASDPNLVSKKLLDFYYDNKKVEDPENIHDFIDMTSDAFFVHPIFSEAKLHNSSLFLYLFNYTGETGIVETMGGNKSLGVTHGDEIPYLFDNSKINLEKLADLEKSKELVRIWTSFAKGLDPKPESGEHFDWNDVSHRGGYLVINNGPIKLGGLGRDNWLKKRLEFWENLEYRS